MINSNNRRRAGRLRKEPPSIEELKEAAVKFRGNKSAMSEYFGVCRNTMLRWLNEMPEVEDHVRHQVMKKFDGYLDTAHALASGVPDIDEKSGKFLGWKIPPDSAMLRFLIERYGAGEGFGKEVKAEVTVVGKRGVPIAKWLELNSEDEQGEAETE